MRFLCISLTSALLLAACGKDKAPDVATPATDSNGPEIAAPDTPTVKTSTSGRDASRLPDKLTRNEPYLQAEINFPRSVGENAPEIAAVILKESRMDMADMERTAKTDAREDMPYDLSSSWEVSGQSGNLMSLVKSTYTFTGGAHGNSYLSGRIYEVSTGRRVQTEELFIDPEAAASRIIPAVRDVIAAEKAIRFGLETGPNKTVTGEVSDAIPMNGQLPAEIALVKSTVPGKFGGLIVMYSPYDIGAYAEGSYEGVVAQEVFAGALKPEYASLFAGDPVDERGE